MSDCSNLYQYIEDKNVVRFAYPYGHAPYISPDGTKVACEGTNLQIKLWSAETGAKLKTLVLVNSHYDKRVFAAVFSPNGELIARSATGYRPLTVWDTNTGKKVSEQQKLVEDNGEEFRDNVFEMIFSNDGLKILAGCDKGSLFIMDAKTGVIIKEFNNRHVYDKLYHGVTSVAFSPDDKRIASGTNNIVKVWDAESGVCLATLKSDYKNDRAVSLAFSPNGEKIASGFSDNSVKVWDIESGELINTLNGHKDRVDFVSFSPDGRRLISGCSEDRTLRVWDAETGKCGTILNIPENEYISPSSAITVLKDSNNKETIVVLSRSIGNVDNNWFVKNNTCNIRKWTNVDEKYNLLKFASKGNGNLLSQSDLDLLNKLYNKKTVVEKEGKTLSPLELRMYNSLLKKYDFSIIMHSDLLQRNTLGYLKGEEPSYKERNLDFKESNPTMGYFPEDDKPPSAPVVGDNGCFGAMCSTRKGGKKGVRKTRRNRKNKTNKNKKPRYTRIRTCRNKK